MTIRNAHLLKVAGSPVTRRLTSGVGAPSKYMQDRAARLKNARIEAGLSQADLAKLLQGYSRNAITAWESARAEPSGDVYLSLAAILRVNPEYLTFGVNPPIRRLAA